MEVLPPQRGQIAIDYLTNQSVGKVVGCPFLADQPGSKGLVQCVQHSHIFEAANLCQ